MSEYIFSKLDPLLSRGYSTGFTVSILIDALFTYEIKSGLKRVTCLAYYVNVVIKLCSYKIVWKLTILIRDKQSSNFSARK